MYTHAQTPQPLFDYAVGVGLAILNASVKNATIAEVDATVEVPLIGGIDVRVTDGELCEYSYTAFEYSYAVMQPGVVPACCWLVQNARRQRHARGRR